MGSTMQTGVANKRTVLVDEHLNYTIYFGVVGGTVVDEQTVLHLDQVPPSRGSCREGKCLRYGCTIPEERFVPDVFELSTCCSQHESRDVGKKINVRKSDGRIVLTSASPLGKENYLPPDELAAASSERAVAKLIDGFWKCYRVGAGHSLSLVLTPSGDEVIVEASTGGTEIVGKPMSRQRNREHTMSCSRKKKVKQDPMPVTPALRDTNLYL